MSKEEKKEYVRIQRLCAAKRSRARAKQYKINFTNEETTLKRISSEFWDKLFDVMTEKQRNSILSKIENSEVHDFEYEPKKVKDQFKD